MKSIVKTTLVLAALSSGATTALAQSANEVKQHEFRPFYGTAYSSSTSDIFAESISNALFGTAERSETSTFGMLGLGYRYHVKRFGVGIDLGYSSAKEEFFKKKKDVQPFETKNMKRYFVMPAASYSYYKTNIIDLYGAVSAGAIYETSKKDIKDAKAETNTEFAYQVTAIGLRVGNQSVGGFVDLGYGHKGLISRP